MSKPSPLASVAGVAQRLGVLLAAGVAPMSAWRYLDETVNDPLVAAVASSGADANHLPGVILASGGGMPALEFAAWRGLAAAWAVATESGAPLAPTLRDYAASLRSLAQAQREGAVALAAPVATARLVMVLPLVGVLFGFALGFDTFHTLVATPLGWGCIVIGGGLMLLASRWNRRLVRAAQPRAATPGLECELMAIALSGGGSIAGAGILSPRPWQSSTSVQMTISRRCSPCLRGRGFLRRSSCAARQRSPVERRPPRLPSARRPCQFG